MEIVHLGERIDAIPIIGRWVYDEWGRWWFPETTPGGIATVFQGRTVPHTIPETFVAVEDGAVVGTASLVDRDLATRLDLSPWLAAVYVVPEHRNRGVGSALVCRVVEEAQALKVKRLYLFTPDRMNFYARLGWQVLQQMEHRGQEITVMVYEVYDGGENDPIDY